MGYYGLLENSYSCAVSGSGFDHDSDADADVDAEGARVVAY